MLEIFEVLINCNILFIVFLLTLIDRSLTYLIHFQLLHWFKKLAPVSGVYTWRFSLDQSTSIRKNFYFRATHSRYNCIFLKWKLPNICLCPPTNFHHYFVVTMTTNLMNWKVMCMHFEKGKAMLSSRIIFPFTHLVQMSFNFVTIDFFDHHHHCSKMKSHRWVVLKQLLRDRGIFSYISVRVL